MTELRFSKHADRDIDSAGIWWRTNRPLAPDLFDDELERVVKIIKTFPDVGMRSITRRYARGARVMVLPDTGHLLVYRRETKTRVRILALLVSKKTIVRP
jgi:plasmid stabilization system protein ParE